MWSSSSGNLILIHVPEFWYHAFIAFTFSRKWSFGFERERGRHSQSQSGRHFPSKTKLKNETKTPGTDQSLLSPDEYSWSLAAFVNEWEWAWERVNLFSFHHEKQWHKNKSCYTQFYIYMWSMLFQETTWCVQNPCSLLQPQFTAVKPSANFAEQSPPYPD